MVNEMTTSHIQAIDEAMLHIVQKIPEILKKATENTTDPEVLSGAASLLDALYRTREKVEMLDFYQHRN